MCEKVIPIKYGPDKWGIISSFADEKIVEFKTDHLSVKGVINTIQHGDEPNSFIFTILVKKEMMSGCYDSKLKKGHLRKTL